MAEIEFVELHWCFIDGGEPASYTVASLENAKKMVYELNARNDGFVHWWQPRTHLTKRASDGQKARAKSKSANGKSGQKTTRA